MAQYHIAFILFMLVTYTTYAQTIWEGPKITFTKANHANPTLEENQDRITDKVWITRGTTRGIYNISTENSYTINSSPADTEWAFGTTADLPGLTFNDWQTTVGNNPPGMVNRNMVLHLISENIYIGLRFLSWSVGAAGGGFSYERSTSLPSANSSNEAFSGRISVFPNPGPTGMVKVSYEGNQHGTLKLFVYGQDGKLYTNETLPAQPGTNTWSLNLSTCDSGIYLLRFRQGSKLTTHKIVLY